MGSDNGELRGPSGGPPFFPEMAPQEGSKQERDVTGVHRAPLAACEEQPVRAEWGLWGETRQKAAWGRGDQTRVGTMAREGGRFWIDFDYGAHRIY